MTKANQFFIIFLLTILVIRLFLFLKPVPAPTIKTFRTHHWMYGLVFIFVAIIFHLIILYAVGLGLFVDELTYLIIGGKNHDDNYSTISLFGTLIFIAVVFFFKNELIYFFK